MLVLAFSDGRFIHLPAFYRARAVGADARMGEDVREALAQLAETDSRAWGIHRFLSYVNAGK
jgi:hypothetical protein